MSKELYNNSKVSIVRAPAALGTTAAGYDGKIIDMQGFDRALFTINYGTRTATNSTMVVLVKEGDATGTLTSVADTNLNGTEANAGLAAATGFTSGTTKNVSKTIEYIGNKRYVTINHKATVTAATIVGSNCVQMAARKDPQS